MRRIWRAGAGVMMLAIMAIILSAGVVGPTLPRTSQVSYTWLDSIRFGHTELWLLLFDPAREVEYRVMQLPDTIDQTTLQWSPDGQDFTAWVEDAETERWHLALVSFDGTIDILPLDLPRVPPDWHLTWSPDGSRLAFALEREVTLYDRETDTLTALDEDGQDIAWSPDGDALAFVRPRLTDDAQDVIIYDLPTGQITHTLATGSTQTLIERTALRAERPLIESPVWSPDGRYLMVHASVNPEFARPVILLYEVATGQTSTLMPGQNGNWNADGSALIYESGRSPNRHNGVVVRREIASGETQQIASGFRPLVSPDGRYLWLFSPFRMFALDGEEPRRLSTAAFQGRAYWSWRP
jgi:dipeptidyl aminopeptidase/acylaminoacyl peptidase